MSKLMLRLKQGRTAFLIYLCRLLCLFKKKRYWVIFERGTDARDNGYFFYRFLKEKHPEIKLYYIIDKKSKDFDKVKADAVQHGSFKNYWVIANAEKLISTHYYCFGVPYLPPKVFDFVRLYENFYYIQHGIMMNYIPLYLCSAKPMKLFVCGAKPEFEYIRDVYGYPESIVEYTGLARYDNLHDTVTKRQILVMPTWRSFITSKEALLASDYYNNWQTLLSDERLIKLLEENDAELIFYPHYEIQKYIDSFNSGSKKVKIAAFENYDVQTLLKESKLLITDYSSVFFDFGYMGKPVAYFQFDKDDFYGKHYQKGYFSFSEMGFGEVCDSAEKVVDVIEAYIKNSFETEEKFRQRIDKFFVLRDRHNCERIYDAIMKR